MEPTACGSTCGGLMQVLTIDQTAASATLGRFTLVRQYARPTSMNNLANEGIAIAPESSCAAGSKGFYWTDDAAANGETLHADSIPCGAYAQ